jgi:hypothetical protein
MLDRPWRHRPIEPVPNVGTFDAVTFDPGTWRPDWPTYLPFRTADRIDKFWGAKIVARFTRSQIAAAVDAARFHDPEAAAYFVETLVARQRATSAYWFARVAPLDQFSVAASGDRVELCFTDLAIANGLADAVSTNYTLATYDWHAQAVGPVIALAADVHGTRCTRIAAAPLDDEGGYTIVRIAMSRPDFTGETIVHLGRDPVSASPRVIGIWRP